MIYIIVPMYNEEQAVVPLFNKIRKVIDKNIQDYHIIVIDDGSVDKTSKLLENYKNMLPIKVIHHRMNRGLGETVRDGFEEASLRCESDDIIVRLEGDNTHDPSYVLQLVDKIKEGWDVVIASRFQLGGGMEGLSSYRRFISKAANLVLKIFFPIKNVREYSCALRAYRGRFVKAAIEIFQNEFISLKGLGFTCSVEKLVKFRMLGARMAEIPFVLRYDKKKTPSKMLTSITTLGYLVLIIKYIHPWGKTGKEWRHKIREFRKELEEK